jgi:hypothetical protein
MASVWVGGRVGALFPFGNAYDLPSADPYYSYGESWEGLASGGLALEGDVGVRFSRRYIIYGFWEHGFMGTGGDPSWRSATATHLVNADNSAVANFGDQTSAYTDFPGLGFRWSSRPDMVGFLIDLGLGYRWFHESWANGASMDLKGFGEFRIGFGADVRVNHLLSVSPVLSFTNGAFHDRTITLPGQPERSIGSYTGTHGTVTLTLGGHFDFAPSY